MCEFPTHFSELACPDLKLELYWSFHSALKFHSNHLRYACLTQVIISILCTTYSFDSLDRGQIKIQSKSSEKTVNK